MRTATERFGTEERNVEERRDVIVRVDSLIADLVPGYLEARKTEISEIRRRIEDRDFDTLQVIGHQLKGSGQGYGFVEITLLGDQIEQAAQRRDLGVLRTTIDQLDEYVHSVTVVTGERR